jgi:hypothetical protein
MNGDLIVEFLDQRPVPRRRRRYATCPPQALSGLPADWRDLLARWVRRGGNSRWDTLKKDAGVSQQPVAHSLLDWLLRYGWVVVDEERKHGDWWPLRVELRDLATLRAALGLPDSDDLAVRWAALRDRLETKTDVESAAVMDALDCMPLQRALARGELVLALLQWRDAERCGTRRDFALFARADTKDITEAEWCWLDEQLDLAAFSVDRHTPLLLVSATLTLEFSHARLDLSAAPDFCALTPPTLASTRAAQGEVRQWILVENRTSFERMARSRGRDVGVLWLPGYPPHWWQEAVTRLLAFAPAPACIACDPDPAGIAIAMAAAGVWRQAGLPFEPWKMAADDLQALPKRLQLTERDRAHLQQLLGEPLPLMLRELAEAMLQCGEKGEQEGYL